MGKLIYGATEYELEDRELAHLQLVVSIKLRRHENFFVSGVIRWPKAAVASRCGSTTACT